MTDETIMKASSQNKKRLMIAILLAVGFLFMSSTTIAMPLLSRAE
jgi:flagellar basal body-associated protein FliL|tara:strand:+ start:2848 stop:2982 length:135 start_codon:yes stop_codon:yes gene_type:complete